MVTTKLNLSMTEPQVRQIYAKQGDTGRVLDISLDQTPEDGTLRILRPDGTEVTSEAVTGGEVSESGETVTFESMTEADVTELTVGIEPVQDLNGYDAPWVGGAGKNLLENTATSATTSGITFTVNADGSVTASGTATADSQFAITIDTSKLYGDYYFVGLYGQAETTANVYIWDNTTNARCKQWDGTTNSTNSFDGTFKQVKIVQGHVVRMTLRVMNGKTVSGLVFRPMICKSTETNPTWQPYSNICPITGHDEVTVTDTGKNLFDKDNPNIVNAYITADGLVQPNPNNRMVYVKVTPNSSVSVTFTQVALPTSTARDDVQAGVFSSEPIARVTGTYKGTWRRASATEDYTYSFSISVGDNDYVGVKIGNTERTDVTASLETLQIEYGTSSTAWTPYQGSTYTTSLGQTVYGGTLDLVSGVLNDTYGYKDIDDFATLTSWTSAGGLYIAEIAGTYTANAPSVCSMLEQKTVNQAWTSTTECYAIEAGKIRVYTTETTLANFKTKFAQLQIAYPLVEPVTYQLTAQQIKTLVGTNNVWASSGDIVNIAFTYGGLLSELPSEATEIVGKCYCDVEQNGVSSMPFTLNVKKNERQ